MYNISRKNKWKVWKYIVNMSRPDQDDGRVVDDIYFQMFLF